MQKAISAAVAAIVMTLTVSLGCTREEPVDPKIYKDPPRDGEKRAYSGGQSGYDKPLPHAD